jgi:hypothetical protein
LKHLEECPFTSVGLEVGFEELLVDTSSMDGTALDAVYSGVTTLPHSMKIYVVLLEIVTVMTSWLLMLYMKI